MKSCWTKCGSIKRSCSAVPQRIRLPSNGTFQNMQTSARTSSICRSPMRMLRRHLKGAQFEQAESKPEAFRRKQLVDAELGAMRVAGYIGQQVSKQSIDDIRGTIARGQMAETRLRVRTARPCAPHPRADTGWWVRRTCRKKDTTATDDSARKRPCCAADRAGAGSGCPQAVAPPITMWLPPPVASRLPLKRISQRSSRFRALRRSSNMLMCSSSSQLLAGGRLTSSTPGSGVTLKDRSRGSAAGA